jgi:hypothetical protein
MKELIEIQSKLNAPKRNYNSFGKYSYRSCEDILAAVKNLLKETGCTLTLADDIIMIGDRYYIKATATLTNEQGEKAITTAYAREEQEKKGMDASQITGTASSYARKYALNGLFAIDDTKDADALNTTAEFTQKPQPRQTATTTTTATNWKDELAACKTVKDVEQVWYKHVNIQHNSEFRDAVVYRQTQLK